MRIELETTVGTIKKIESALETFARLCSVFGGLGMLLVFMYGGARPGIGEVAIYAFGAGFVSDFAVRRWLRSRGWLREGRG